MIVNPLDENKKRIEEEARKEAMAFEERARLQKEQAKKLKIDARKRELEEIKRKVALKTSEKNGLTLALNDLKNKERIAEQSARNSGRTNFKEDDILNKKQEKEKIRREIELFEMEMGQKKRSGAQKISLKQNEINTKKKELDKLKQQVTLITIKLSKLEEELSILKNQGPDSASKKELELARKINAEKEIEQEIEALEKNKNLSQSQTNSTKRTEVELKRKIEGEERRLTAVEQELQKLIIEQKRLEQEIGVL
ncbi:MAG: hypothetical protein WC587_01075 [Candidatus Paceibacterota bacterium]